VHKYDNIITLEVTKHVLFSCLQSLANQSPMDNILNKVEKLRLVAAKFNVPMSQLDISWCAKDPNVSSD
jgi:aryl-alcohol dehydrogenase-like predicted oxidoreductase